MVAGEERPVAAGDLAHGGEIRRCGGCRALIFSRKIFCFLVNICSPFVRLFNNSMVLGFCQP